jgi:hypothetical protein
MPRNVSIDKPELSPFEIALLRRYLAESHLFSGQEWRDLRQIVDRLASCEVQFGTKQYRFTQFYRTFIDGTYARPFLAELVKLIDVNQGGQKLQARIARQIWEWLRLNGVQPGQVLHAEYLVVYCLYRWGAFARGHVFEVTIVRDLLRAGIKLIAHDPATERFAPYDLEVPELGYGDVKTSVYFLDELTANTPSADFYVTRLYVSQSREHRRVVFATPQCWSRLWSAREAPREGVVPSLAEAVANLPRVSKVQLEHLSWFVVEYEAWKQSLLQWQQEDK